MRYAAGVENLLARVEERLRVRLHQAANRMEDADPVAVDGALAGVRVLDLVDRLTGFRARHSARVTANGRATTSISRAAANRASSD